LKSSEETPSMFLKAFKITLKKKSSIATKRTGFKRRIMSFGYY
jgi:hypothetical protein